MTRTVRACSLGVVSLLLLTEAAPAQHRPGMGLANNSLPTAPSGRSGDTGPTRADSVPVASVERFFDAFGALRFDDLAASVHPETLDLYRYYVVSIVDADSTGAFAERVFGSHDSGRIRALPPTRVFAQLVAEIYEATPGLIEVIATNAYDLLGHVAEGDSLAHVVGRVTPYTTGSAPTKLTTVTVKRWGDGWRVSTSPELDALTTAMRGLTFRPSGTSEAGFDWGPLRRPSKRYGPH